MCVNFFKAAWLLRNEDRKCVRAFDTGLILEKKIIHQRLLCGVKVGQSNHKSTVCLLEELQRHTTLKSFQKRKSNFTSCISLSYTLTSEGSYFLSITSDIQMSRTFVIRSLFGPVQENIVV